MASFSEGGGGGGGNSMFSGAQSATANIMNSVKRSGRRASRKKSRSSLGSGLGRAVSSVARGVSGNSNSNGGKRRRSGNNSYRRSQSSNQNYGSGRSGYNPPRNTGANSSGVIAPVAPKPVPKTPEQWLAGDTTYTSQQNSYQKALKDYLANYNSELQKYGNEYKAATDKVGLERQEGLTNMADDFAGRGLLNSGVYGESLQKYNTDMDTRLADMQRAKSAYEGDLLADKNTWQGTQAELLQRAKQEALQRRLATYGL